MADWVKWRAGMLDEMLALGLGAEQAATELRVAEARMRARLDWLKGLFEELRQAHDRCSDACAELSDEELEEDLDLPEFREVKRIERAIEDVRNEKWPRHLHWKDI